MGIITLSYATLYLKNEDDLNNEVNMHVKVHPLPWFYVVPQRGAWFYVEVQPLAWFHVM